MRNSGREETRERGIQQGEISTARNKQRKNLAREVIHQRGVIQRGKEGIHRGGGSSNGGGDILEEGLCAERSFFFPRTLYTPDSTSFFLLFIPFHHPA